MPLSAVQMEVMSPKSLFLNGAVKRKFDDECMGDSNWDDDVKSKVRTVGDRETESGCLYVLSVVWLYYRS